MYVSRIYDTALLLHMHMCATLCMYIANEQACSLPPTCKPITYNLRPEKQENLKHIRKLSAHLVDGHSKPDLYCRQTDTHETILYIENIDPTNC